MDPCPFVRILVGNLALKFPVASKPTFSGVHPSSSPCYCKIKFNNFPHQIATIPLTPLDANSPDPHTQTVAACFNLNKSDLKKLADNKLFSKKPRVKIAIYTGRTGKTCGLNSGKLLGSVSVPIDLDGVESKPCVFQNGWISVGDKTEKRAAAQLRLSVRAEPDPRFVFEFDGEPECSPQVFQIQGNVRRQPVFTCKFSFRNDHNLRSRSSLSESSSSGGKERKGWSVTVHDLSGSPVASASMVTPFVPSPGSDQVSRSNPGAWLILRPSQGTWNPWGRLEAWRERGTSDGIGYRFEDVTGGNAVIVASSNLSTKKGGKFLIEVGNDRGRGFVMSSTVEGVGKYRKPVVEVGVHHVTCMEDAAAFVALAAAMDLSMDACRPFSQKLRKELRQHSQE